MKKQVTKENLLMFIKMVILGLKCNPKLPGVGDEIEKIYNETFDKKLNSEDILND